MPIETRTPDERPLIAAFCCNWCSYAGADLAGTSRLNYPADVKIIRVPCSCRVNPLFILRAFQRGYAAQMPWPQERIEPCQMGRLLWKVNWVARHQPQWLADMVAKHLPVFEHYEQTGQIICPPQG